MTDELLRQWGSNIRIFRRVRDLREGLSDEVGKKAMAAALEVSLATISRWENGRMAPRDDRKVEIAEYLDVDVRALFPLVRAS